jgi:hypothetical protein
MHVTSQAGLGVSLLMLVALVSGRAARSADAARASPVKEPAKMTRQKDSAAIILASALQQALRQYFPSYRLPTKEFAPAVNYDVAHGVPPVRAVRYLCTGDFDGNGCRDVALYLIESGPSHRLRRHHIPRRRWLFVVFHRSARGTFQPHVLARRYTPEFWRNEYTEALNRMEDDALGLQPRRSRFHYFGPGGIVRGPMRHRYDGILEATDDGEVDFVYYWHRGRYHSVNLSGDE